ncbi:MAG: hypothetical protein AB7E55_18235 [Pigmentiphaga sp.]
MQFEIPCFYISINLPRAVVKEERVATKRENSRNENIPLLLGLFLFTPFLIFSLLHYARLRKKFPQTETSQRILDIGSVVPSLLWGGAITFFAWIILTPYDEKSGSVLPLALMLLVIWVLYKIAKSVAASYYGVIVDIERDVIFFKKDMANYGVEDCLQLKFIRELGDIESVQLSQIKKVTREAGKKLYIHGPFGSRGIHFSNKQKRDECISAIEASSRARTAFEFEIG